MSNDLKTFACEDCGGYYAEEERCPEAGKNYCPVCHIDRFGVELHTNDD